MSTCRGGGRRGGRATEPVRASNRLRGVDGVAPPTAPSIALVLPDPSTDPSSTGFPDALLENPTNTTDENEVPPATKTRKTRGPTKRSAETNRGRDAPRIWVTFSKGAPVSDMMNTFKTTVLGWIHAPLILPQNVKKYDDIPFVVKEALFKRINDLFEIVVVHRPTPSQGEAESSSQAPDPTANTTSTATSHPTATHDSSTASSPDLPGRVLDPTSCLPLSVADRYVVEGWVRDRFRSHRNEICQKHYDAYEIDEERMAHPPPNWLEDMWQWVVHYWGTDEYKKKRVVGKANKSKSLLKHTAGSENYKNKRYKIELETGEEVDERQFFIQTHTKKDGSFVDDASRIIAEKIQERTAQLTLETGEFIGTDSGVLQDVVGRPTKGRELLMGRVPPKPKTRGISVEEMQRVLEEQRRELEQSHQRNMQEMERRFNERMNSMSAEIIARLQQQQPSQQDPPPHP